MWRIFECIRQWPPVGRWLFRHRSRTRFKRNRWCFWETERFQFAVYWCWRHWIFKIAYWDSSPRDWYNHAVWVCLGPCEWCLQWH